MSSENNIWSNMNDNEGASIDMNKFSISEEIAKFDKMKVDGWDVVIRLYMEPQQTAGGLWKTAKTIEEGEYANCVGLVVKIAEGAYKDPRYEQTGRWCEVGEWRMFPRHGGNKYKYKGIPIFVMKEDAIGPRVEDPRDVSR